MIGAESDGGGIDTTWLLEEGDDVSVRPTPGRGSRGEETGAARGFVTQGRQVRIDRVRGDVEREEMLDLAYEIV